MPKSVHARVSGASAGLAQTVQVRQHTIASDEIVEDGGTDTGPRPYELLLGALGSCTSMTISLYARRKGWPLERVEVELSHAKDSAPDRPTTDQIERVIHLFGALDEEQRTRLLEIAGKCPVHKTLHSSGVQITTRLA